LRRSELAAEWNFLATDLLGHGARPFDPSNGVLNLEAVARDLLSQIPDGPFYALGHSFGLRPLLKIAQWESPRFKALIVEDSSPSMGASSYHKLEKILSSVPVPFRNREEAKVTLDHLFPDDPRLAAFLLTNIRKLANGELNWRFDRESLLGLLAEAYQHPLWSEWSRYPNPVYLIRGERSDFVTLNDVDKCRSERHGKEFHSVQISQAAHWVHSDQPEQFCEEVVKILKTL
jgi:pimeloyl-ACP methyl ester carboxylesterase